MCILSILLPVMLPMAVSDYEIKYQQKIIFINQKSFKLRAHIKSHHKPPLKITFFFCIKACSMHIMREI